MNSKSYQALCKLALDEWGKNVVTTATINAETLQQRITDKLNRTLDEMLVGVDEEVREQVKERFLKKIPVNNPMRILVVTEMQRLSKRLTHQGAF
jgi:DNA primase catalytic subunit